MLKTIIMDFDGLIVDTEVVWYHIYVEWFRREKGYDLSVQEFLTCVGSNSEDLFRKLDAKGVTVDRDAFAKDTFAQFIEQSSRLPAKPGVEDFLKQAHANGLSVALATSSSRKKPTVHLERCRILICWSQQKMSNASNPIPTCSSKPLKSSAARRRNVWWWRIPSTGFWPV